MKTLLKLVVPNHGFEVVGSGNQVGLVAFEKIHTIDSIRVAIQGEKGLFFTLKTPNLFNIVL